jgi:predicted transcriptional regulator
MVRTQIQLSEQQASRLKKIAMARHMSIAELIRRAVDAMLATGPAVDVEEKRKRALSAAGRFSSGKRDISKSHDSYLAEAYRK